MSVERFFFQRDRIVSAYSWVIWSTSVTVESKGRFFSGFVFYEG